MQRPLLRMSFPDRAALAQEHEANLKHGRAFIKDASGVAALTDCWLQLVLEDSGALLAVEAQAVLVCDSGPVLGIGVQLRPFNPEVATKLDAFVTGTMAVKPEQEPEPAREQEQEPAREQEREPEPEPAQEPEPEPAQELEPDSDSDSEPAQEQEPEPDSEPESESEQETESDSDSDDLPADQQRGPARHERLRKLSLAQQQKVARTGNLNDRVTLERLFGKQVWESLLHNAKVTVPEVARIARKGTIPRPLLELIVDNNNWIQAAIVRRALLGNPRVSTEAIMKLLRMTPKHELKAIHKTTTYSSQVREAARKVLEL